MERLPQVPKLPERFVGQTVRGAAIGTGIGVLGNLLPFFYDSSGVSGSGARGLFLSFWPVKFGTAGALYGAGRATRLANGELGEGENKTWKAFATAGVAGSGLALAESFGYYVAGGIAQNLPLDFSSDTIRSIATGSLIYYGSLNALSYLLGRSGVIEKAYDEIKPDLQDFYREQVKPRLPKRRD